jgi:hypothetical protein
MQQRSEDMSNYYKKLLTDEFFTKIAELLTNRAVNPHKLIRAVEFEDDNRGFGNLDIEGLGEHTEVFYEIKKDYYVTFVFTFSEDEVLEEIKVKNVKETKDKGDQILNEEVIFSRLDEVEKLKNTLKEKLAAVMK